MLSFFCTATKIKKKTPKHRKSEELITKKDNGKDNVYIFVYLEE